MRRLRTRRELVTGAAAAAGAATGVAGLAGAAAADAPVTDPEALTKVLEVERLMVLAYRRVLASGALAPNIEQAITPYLAHEVEHVSTVASHLTATGADAPTGPLSVDAAGALMSKYYVSGSVTHLHSQHDCLRLLVDLESLAEGVYFTALKTLSEPGLQQLAAQIMACEAQHWTMISGLRNPGQYVKAVPWPFVTGY